MSLSGCFELAQAESRPQLSEQTQKDNEPKFDAEPQGTFSPVDGHISLEKLPNVRDLGYLKTGDDQNTLSTALIRSGGLNSASDADIATLLTEFNVRTVIDLRTEEEKTKSPDPQDKMQGVRFVDAPILGYTATGITRENGLEGLAKSLATLNADPTQLMIELYPKMLLEDSGVQGYSRFFATLADNEEGAVLWHCSAGKDRAGLAAVLLQYALGVAKRDILADYLATNTYLAGRADDLIKLFPAEYRTENFVQGLQILNSANENFLIAGIKAVENEYGSLEKYYKDALGVDEGMRELLRNKYLV